MSISQVSRVLVAGIRHSDNQFTRKLQRDYNLEVIHTDIDSPNFPLDADVAIVVRSQINSNKLRNIKDKYGGQGKPVFVASQGFSDIKMQFDNFLYELGRNKPQPVKKTEPAVQVRKASPFNQIQIPISVVQDVPEKVEPKISEIEETEETTSFVSSPKRVNPPEVMEKLYKIVADCQAAGYNVKDTVEMIAAEKITKVTGEPYVDYDVHNMRAKLRKDAQRAQAPADKPALFKQPEVLPKTAEKIEILPKTATSPEILPKKVEEPSLVSRTVQQPPLGSKVVVAPEKALTALELIGLVLSAEGISDQERLDLVADIHKGKISTMDVSTSRICRDEQGSYLLLEKFNLKTSKNRISVTLDKAACELVIQHSDAVLKFAQTETL